MGMIETIAVPVGAIAVSILVSTAVYCIVYRRRWEPHTKICINKTSILFTIAWLIFQEATVEPSKARAGANSARGTRICRDPGNQTP